MSFYVKRWKGENVAWTGPIRAASQASAECEAWQRAGWRATAHVATPIIRGQVKAWEAAKKKAKGGG